MKFSAYAVFDRVAKHYNFPFFDRDQNRAIAVFKQACQSPETILYQFPDSYALVRIGIYDDEEGTFENISSEVICLATEFVKDKATSSDNNS